MSAAPQYAVFALAGFFLAAASLVPETWFSLLFALGSAALFSLALQLDRRILRGSLLCGVCFHLVAFYWVPQTVQLFGGFSSLGAYLVFLLFACSASLQFLLVAFVWRRCSSSCDARYCFALPLAWMLLEYSFPRLFPWQIGHALVVLQPIAATAEYLGVTVLSGVLVWWGAVLTASVKDRRVLRSAYLPVLSLSLLLLVAGVYRNSQVARELEQSPKLKIAMVQGNLSTEKKGNLAFLQANIEKYRALSAEAVARGAEVVFWPESVVNQWLPQSLENLRDSQFDPAPNLGVPLVYGTLGFAEKSEAELEEVRRRFADRPDLLREMQYHKYNAAVGIDAESTVVGRYFKRVLMPFGEFLPFEQTFPSLRRLSPQTGDFSAGRIESPIHFSAEAVGLPLPLRLGILICYEDLVPTMSTEMVERGANLLVNLTNDAWYGDTAAPHQHHLLAQWRAIETRRYLLRVTNTGKTAVVNPYGRTQNSLPAFTEEFLLDDVHLLSTITFYARYPDLLLLLLIAFGLALVIVCRRSESPRASQ